MAEPFERQFQGDWTKRTPEEQRADEAAVDYDANCEAYDRLICGHDGIPKTGQHHYLVNKHAIETRDRLIREYRITRADFDRAINRLRMERNP